MEESMMARWIGWGWMFALCALACGCGRSIGGVNGAPLCDGGACALSSCDGGSCAPPACVSGASCALADPCSVGAIECLGDSPMCIHSSNAPDGTPCGNGETCAGGSCGLCADVGEACTVPGNACVLGTRFCTGSGASACSPTGNVPDGTSCGGGEVCLRGTCIDCTPGASCSPADNPCNAGAIDCSGSSPACVDTGMPAANGDSCGLSKVCNQGACVDCAAGTPCDTGGACRLGTISCATGAPVCNETSAIAADGMTCGANLVCFQGTCTPCTTGASCVFGGSPCLSGITFCNTGQPLCTSSTPVADGTPCGANDVCSGGACEPQLALTPASTSTLTAAPTWSGTLANLSDFIASDTSADLAVTIDWGESTTPGTIAGSNGVFTVGGTHTFSSGVFGLIDVTITVSDSETGASVSTVVSMVAGVTEIALQNPPNAICAGPDGNMWFTVPAGQIGRVTLAGAATLFLLPTGSVPSGIAPGSDGNVWFTDPGTDAIGQITPSGGVTEFPLATGSQPRGITLGPDGSLWFTEVTANAIGTITTSGALTEFPIPTANGMPTGIAVGPDANLWFTESGADQIGRITPAAGQVTEFTGASDQPLAIAAGSDGNLWFSQSESSSLGRITPAGAIDAVSVVIETQAIAAGPDGNIWFAGSTYPFLAGRVTPGGSVSSYSMPFDVSGIAAGPDGNVWFAESAGIAHLSP